MVVLVAQKAASRTKFNESSKIDDTPVKQETKIKQEPKAKIKQEKQGVRTQKSSYDTQLPPNPSVKQESQRLTLKRSRNQVSSESDEIRTESFSPYSVPPSIRSFSYRTQPQATPSPSYSDLSPLLSPSLLPAMSRAASSSNIVRTPSVRSFKTQAPPLPQTPRVVRASPEPLIIQSRTRREQRMLEQAREDTDEEDQSKNIQSRGIQGKGGKKK